MRDAVFANLEPATVVIKCAAVADFRPSIESKQKIKKTSARVSLELDPTPRYSGGAGTQAGRPAAGRLRGGDRESARGSAPQAGSEELRHDGGESRRASPIRGFESDSNEVAAGAADRRIHSGAARVETRDRGSDSEPDAEAAAALTARRRNESGRTSPAARVLSGSGRQGSYRRSRADVRRRLRRSRPQVRN